MFTSFHMWDLVPLVIVALLIFGPKRLPQMGSAIGQTIKEFQKSMKQIREPEAAEQTAALPPASAPTERVD
ncbi:MAG TPA: twin-arginine translocase TatA/TatE family subunit [Ktedonobacterales bacterium]|nr:twin-arginine translocase TatA/TatE family subunit [Ktedonobacterales bacterium]